jgi:hypothetical protein
MALLFALPTSADRHWRIVLFVTRFRVHRDADSPRRCGLFGIARAGGALTRNVPASDVPFSLPGHHRFPVPSLSRWRSFERAESAAAVYASGDALLDSPWELETRPTSAGLGPKGSHLETSDVVPEPECIGCAR